MDNRTLVLRPRTDDMPRPDRTDGLEAFENYADWLERQLERTRRLCEEHGIAIPAEEADAHER